MALLLEVDRHRAAAAIALAVSVCCALHAESFALAADKFKRLSSTEIRARIVGKVVTDESHWSDRFEPDGTLRAIDLGVLEPGTWKLNGNEMCVVRKAKKPVTECFEIWASGDEVEYRRDGITLASGVLRKE
jgi:hypothetical protein